MNAEMPAAASVEVRDEVASNIGVNAADAESLTPSHWLPICGADGLGSRDEGDVYLPVQNAL